MKSLAQAKASSASLLISERIAELVDWRGEYRKVMKLTFAKGACRL